jgi:hypothetical protein
MFKLYINFSNDFDKGETYIIYKWIYLSYSFLKSDKVQDKVYKLDPYNENLY